MHVYLDGDDGKSNNKNIKKSITITIQLRLSQKYSQMSNHRNINLNEFSTLRTRSHILKIHISLEWGHNFIHLYTFTLVYYVYFLIDHQYYYLTFMLVWLPNLPCRWSQRQWMRTAKLCKFILQLSVAQVKPQCLKTRF